MGIKDSLKYVGLEILRGIKKHEEKIDRQRAKLDDAEIKYSIDNDLDAVIHSFESVLINEKYKSGILFDNNFCWNPIKYQIELVHFYQKAGLRDRAWDYMNQLAILPNLYDYRDISRIRYEQSKQVENEKRYMYALKMLTISYFYSIVYLPKNSTNLYQLQINNFKNKAEKLIQKLEIPDYELEKLIDALILVIENAKPKYAEIYDETEITDAFNDWEKSITAHEKTEYKINKLAVEKQTDFCEFLKQIKPIAQKQAMSTSGNGFDEEMLGIEHKKFGDYQNAIYMFYIAIYKKFDAPALYIECSKVLRKYKLYDEEKWVLIQGMNNVKTTDRIKERLDKLDIIMNKSSK